MDPFIGQIVMFGGNFAPRSWALCNGQLLPISQYTALYSIIGVYYGGDGRSTFALPDLRGRFAVGTGQGPGLQIKPLGAMGGSETNVLSMANLPAHNHAGSLHVSSANASQSAATNGATIATPGTLAGRTFTPTEGFNASAPNITLNTETVTTGITGGSAAINNMQPFNTVNYIICLEGIYPSRN